MKGKKTIWQIARCGKHFVVLLAIGMAAVLSGCGPNGGLYAEFFVSSDVTRVDFSGYGISFGSAVLPSPYTEYEIIAPTEWPAYIAPESSGRLRYPDTIPAIVSWDSSSGPTPETYSAMTWIDAARDEPGGLSWTYPTGGPGSDRKMVIDITADSLMFYMDAATVTGTVLP